MAHEVLKAIHAQKRILHEVHHDLESFAWVFAYTFWRRSTTPPLIELLKKNGQDDARLMSAFRSIFGYTTTSELLVARSGADPLELPPFHDILIPGPLKKLFDELHEILYCHGSATRKFANFTPLTYEMLLASLRRAVTVLEEMAGR
ncbi:hypothetical protein HWV62_26424 [Athelia sp. TMB]|nr:hypothetical protein HWV62_26424 [Athelia sp. TMB]